MSKHEIHFGICPCCGGDGASYAEVSSADATPRKPIGYGMQLFSFRGQWWCEICIKEELAKEETERQHRGLTEEEEFRARIGFQNEVSEE